MTVCIGAICADWEGRPGRAAVVASDRMVTYADFTEFEHEVPKIIPINGTILTLVSGDSLRGSRLSRDIGRRIPVGAVTVDAVAEIAAQQYSEHRRRQVEAEIFTPRGMTMEAFYQEGQQQRLLPPIAGGMDQQVMMFTFGVDMLLVGVDDSGGHLYSVANPGMVSDYEPIGFAAIGSGAIHAAQSMIGFAHCGARSLQETVFSVYVSKRRAEAAPGVGKDTDLAIIIDRGTAFLAQSVLAALDELFNDYQRPVTEELKGRLAELQLVEEGFGSGYAEVLRSR